MGCCCCKKDKRISPALDDTTRSTSPDNREPITVTRVDLNVRNNTLSHFTNEYAAVEKGQLVVRRGQAFEVDIDFNREYDKGRDDIKIVFQFGKSSSTKAEMNLGEKPKTGEWGASIKSKKGNSVKVTIISPADCSVGKWKFTIHRHDNGVAVYKSEDQDVYILFNPWCKADFVYLKDSNSVREYVLSDTGRIYMGSSSRISYKPWAFGQFEDTVLDCAMFLLDEMSGIEEEYRGDPVTTVRRLSAVINSPDEGGVLVGNWSGKYEGGVSPLDWSGSNAILDQFYTTRRPVKFGQCWVFSGVTTTICRALGIPVRSVTNFASAHDTDGSITIDYLVDAAGKRIKGGDSIWNFHVWNEVWMARSDLPAGFGGWQVIDATPQERSGGVFCLGPASVNSIKTGNVQLPHDGKFVFAEVNADKLQWKVNPDKTKELLSKQTANIGLNISTKSVRSSAREDLTRQYKHPEGSKEERAAVQTALLSSTSNDIDEAYSSGSRDVTFDLLINPDTYMGETVEIALKVKNTSGEERRIDGHIILSSMYYTGVHHKDLKDHEINAKILKPNEVDEIRVEIPDNEYLADLMDHCMLNISCLFIVKETNQTYYSQEELRLRKAHLTIKAPTKGRVGDRTEVEVYFTNPLGVTLTNCELRVEGPGLLRPLQQQHKDVDIKGRFEATFDITPFRAGNRELLVTFNCNQIRNVNASHEITIQ